MIGWALGALDALKAQETQNMDRKENYTTTSAATYENNREAQVKAATEEWFASFTVLSYGGATITLTNARTGSQETYSKAEALRLRNWLSTLPLI